MGGREVGEAVDDEEVEGFEGAEPPAGDEGGGVPEASGVVVEVAREEGLLIGGVEGGEGAVRRGAEARGAEGAAEGVGLDAGALELIEEGVEGAAESGGEAGGSEGGGE